MNATVQNLKIFLRASGMSQRNLASILGVHEAQVHRWVNGKASPNRFTSLEIKRKLKKLEKELDLSSKKE